MSQLCKGYTEVVLLRLQSEFWLYSLIMGCTQNQQRLQRRFFQFAGRLACSELLRRLRFHCDSAAVASLDNNHFHDAAQSMEQRILENIGRLQGGLQRLLVRMVD